jgi:hypothetical protein
MLNKIIPGCDVRLLSADETCPCGSTLTVIQCSHGPRPQVDNPQLEACLLFTVPSPIVGAPSSYAIQWVKLTGDVPAADIVHNIQARLHSVTVQNTIRRLPSFRPVDSPAPVGTSASEVARV